MKNRHVDLEQPWKFDRVGGRVTLPFFIRIHLLTFESFMYFIGFYVQVCGRLSKNMFDLLLTPDSRYLILSSPGRTNSERTTTVVQRFAM